jgi:hypothetical protein
MSGDYEFEPVPGLPEELPEGETLLWQGAPDWKSIATRVLHIRGTAVYFALLLTWYAVSKLHDGEAPYAVTESVARLALFAALALALIGLYGWASAKSTLYTVTSRRVVIRAGVALPMVLNLPFAKIDSVDLKTYSDGSGDIALTLAASERVAYLMLWPHAQPWRLARARPMLRGVPQVSAAAEILGQALSAAHFQNAAQPVVSAQPQPQIDWAAATASPAHRPHATALA